MTAAGPKTSRAWPAAPTLRAPHAGAGPTRLVMGTGGTAQELSLAGSGERAGHPRAQGAWRLSLRRRPLSASRWRSPPRPRAPHGRGCRHPPLCGKHPQTLPGPQPVKELKVKRWKGGCGSALLWFWFCFYRKTFKGKKSLRYIKQPLRCIDL